MKTLFPINTPFLGQGLCKLKKMGIDGRREMKRGVRRDGDFLQIRILSEKHC